LQNRLIQTSQTGGQKYSDTSPFGIPWISTCCTEQAGKNIFKIANVQVNQQQFL
jgi:hypothetical protein